MSLSEVLRRRLEALASAGLLRDRKGALEQAGLINVCSNDYLGYGRLPVSRETSQAGAGASRLIHGTLPEHLALEAELSSWVGTEAALLFASGYVANLSTISCLAGRGDLIVSDALNHASIIDGCRLSRAEVVVVPHRDPGAVEAALRRPTQGARWVVTESYFSMDGDTPRLEALRRLCDEAGAFLLVDEAHALGVFGPSGSGQCRADGVIPDVLVGTLGKAVGVHGAFVAGSAALADFLWNKARGFVFSTAQSPVLAQMALQNVRTVRGDDAGRERLMALSSTLEGALRTAGVPLADGRHGPLFPIPLGTPERATAAAASLRRAGFLTQAIRPPTVPPGTSRLRVALHARLTDENLRHLAAALIDACRA